MITLKHILFFQKFLQSKMMCWLRDFTFVRRILRMPLVEWLRLHFYKKRQKILLLKYGMSPDNFVCKKLPYIYEIGLPLELEVHGDCEVYDGRLEYRWGFQKTDGTSEMIQDWSVSRQAFFQNQEAALIAFQLYVRERETEQFLFAKWMAQVNFLQQYKNLDDVEFSEFSSEEFSRESLLLSITSQNINLENFEYQWMIKRGGGLWNIAKPWCGDTSFNFKPQESGLYSFQVLIRDKTTKHYVLRKKWRNEVSMTSHSEKVA